MNRDVGHLIAHDIELEYDLRRAFPDYSDYFDDWATRSAAARERLSPQIDVRYGGESREKMDLFIPEAPSGSMVVFVHGGYWRFMDKSDFSFVAVPYFRRNTSVALINYSLFPGTTMPNVVNQVMRACSWLAEDPLTRNCSIEMHLIGWSAGAHLSMMATAMLGLQNGESSFEGRLRTVLGISGVYDLRPLLLTSANADLRLDKESARGNSPIHFSPPNGVRMAVMWGSAETDEFRRQSRGLAAAWKRKGADLLAAELPNAHHYEAMNLLADEESKLARVSASLIGSD
jgi:arylformamidase